MPPLPSPLCPPFAASTLPQQINQQNPSPSPSSSSSSSNQSRTKKRTTTPPITDLKKQCELLEMLQYDCRVDGFDAAEAVAEKEKETQKEKEKKGVVGWRGGKKIVVCETLEKTFRR
ncbi:MAG: hypothetical protein M1816_008030 [Peltula sp. TS41687]|nr:MAG: hypothetical protein M1816_008030 [Peltula sp. TS41687]